MIEVPQAEGDESVKALTADLPTPALDERVLIRGSGSGGLYPDTVVSEDLIESVGVLEIELADEVLNRKLHSTGLLKHQSGLSCYPLIIGLDRRRRADHPP
ncbi:hypothetical protein [Bythopirellula goksoeyrii]|nr:hypothetical protein [Bythopirellula goksoeyrii]